MLGQKVLLADLNLLLQRVSADIDDFHAVPECGLDGAQVVARGQEHDLAQVVVQVEVIVVEGVVLLRVKHLKQGGGRVAVVVPSQFVDLVQDEQRVARARFLEVLEHPSRHGADVGLPVATDFGFVA